MLPPNRPSRSGPNFSAWIDALTSRNPFTLSRWLICWILLGISCGLFASLYWIVLEALIRFLERVEGINLLLLLPLFGFLIGLVIQTLGNPGEIGLIINNIHSRNGRIEARENPAMILTSLLSISVGGSLGPEAPMVQVTGSLGTWLADRLGVKGEDLRCFSLAGMAAGFTALFGAPLGGAFFALEILHHQYVLEYYQAILPAIVASCASYIVFALMTHLEIGPTWSFPQYPINRVEDFALAMIYALVGAVAGWLFVYLFKACAWAFARISAPVYWRTTLAGLILAVLALLLPLSRYFGHEQLNTVVEQNFTASFLLWLALGKMLAIAVTVQGEWRGGFIIPLFFTGACLGKAIAVLFPGVPPGLAMISVMAALNASVTRTPISTTLLLTKLTGFAPFAPILFASLVGFFLSPKHPLISAQMKKAPPQH